MRVSQKMENFDLDYLQKKYGKAKTEMLSRMSVTQRVRSVRQPRLGYIKAKDFTMKMLGEGIDALNPIENVKPTLIGLAVDYLTRFMTGTSAAESFRISLLGAEMLNESIRAKKMIELMKGLDNASIRYAIQLAAYDPVFRAGVFEYPPDDEISPDEETAENVRTMVTRSIHFFEVFGKKILDGFTFEGGYTDTVLKGDGDFTTHDTLWEFKVSKFPPNKDHTLQLLIYWRLGLHSIHQEFRNIKYLGIFNPRRNETYRIAVDDIPSDVIKVVEANVIGYMN